MKRLDPKLKCQPSDRPKEKAPSLPGKTRDISGKRFGRLIAIDVFVSEKSARRRFYWNCVCDCGSTTKVEASNLVAGAVVSCGCLRNERVRAARKTEASKFKTLNATWRLMIDRCYNKSNKQYKDYGGRGIQVCEEWRDSFISFAKDMSPKPSGFTLGRIDNDGHYCKLNCRWETHKQQARNTRRTVWIEVDGVKKSLPEWCEIFNVTQSSVRHRIHRGWPVGKGLFVGVRHA